MGFGTLLSLKHYKTEVTITDSFIPQRRVLSAPEQIVRSLKEKILDGTYSVGDHLPSESQIALEFGVSRPTAREALKILQNMSLVVSKPGLHGGYFVTGVPSDSFIANFGNYLSMGLEMQHISAAELYEFRKLVEVRVAGLAAERRSEEEVEHLGNLIRLSSINTGEFLSKDLAFHRALASASRNRLFDIAVGAINLSLNPLLRSQDLASHIPALEVQLHDIYRAIRAKDAPSAEDSMTNHLRFFWETFASSSGEAMPRNP